MTVSYLVYASQPFGYDELTLASILAIARRNNTRDHITGALICRDDIYLQMIEGPHEAVQAAYVRIGYDDRHIELMPMCSGERANRLFPDWAMRHDPVNSWLWSAEDVAAGCLASASPNHVTGLFERLAREWAAAGAAVRG
jgi:hypothetical protein